jgi:hypothetical protein
MNKFSRRLGMLSAIGLGLSLSQTALAAASPTPVLATATIDWSHLQLSVNGVSGVIPTVAFSNNNTSLNSSITSAEGSENHSIVRNNWTSNAQTGVGGSSSVASGLASPDIFSGMANATGTGTTVNISGNRSADFSFDGPVVLTVSVPYTISLTGASSDCCNFDFASLGGNASFNSFASGGMSNSSSGVSFSIDSFGDLTSPRSGNLVFGIVASDAGTGSLSIGFNLSTNGVGVVPEPESYATILAGLGLIGAVVKRRNKLTQPASVAYSV